MKFKTFIIISSLAALVLIMIQAIRRKKNETEYE